jgi:two-component sensor histidine kinase
LITAPLSPDVAVPMEPRWRGLTRYGVRVVIVSALVGLAISILEPTWRSALENTAHAECIGLAVFLFHAVPRGSRSRPGWTFADHARRALISIPLGFVVGIVVARAALGEPLGFRTFQSITPFAGLVTVVSTLGFMYYFWADRRLAEATAAQAEARRIAAEGHLKLLQTQIEPHMLFNTLANLRSLVEIDPPRAQTMIDELIVYLRATLSASRAATTPLAAEFEQLRAYLELMTVRMAHRLRYTLDLPDDLRDAAIPPMLLQPLVENAIRHGLEPKVAGGRIDVTARRVGNGLVIEVLDDGVGAGVTPLVPGYGLTHVRERLQALHGEEGRLTTEPMAAGGMRMTVELPLTTSTR